MDQSGGAGQLEFLRAGDDATRDAGDVSARHDAARDHAARHDSALIDFQGVGHTYRSIFGRTIRAVDGFSLSIRAGEVFGLAGPNGAGKSTLISLLLGFIEPTDGEIRIDGMRPRQYVEKNGIGYLSELIAIPPRWKLEEALARYAILSGVEAREQEARVAFVMETLGLDEQRGKRIKQLSKGNLQRLGLAQALLRDDRILILDEPTHGLDPVWTQRFRDVVEALRRPGRTIFIASHNLDELQRLADRVAIIDRGSLQRLVEPRSAARPKGDVPYRIAVIGDAASVTRIIPDAISREDGEFELPPRSLEQLNGEIAALVASNLMIVALRPTHSVLEQHFREAISE